jgi:drug/metabolite transporter (DMT)-like permease
MIPRTGLAYAGLLLASLCWSGNALVARAFHHAIGPMSLAFWRWALVLLILLPVVAVPLWQRREQLRRNLARLLVLSALAIVSYNALLYSAARSTTAINITLLTTCLPLATYLGAGLLLGEWPSRRAWLGMLVATLGLLLLIGQGRLGNLLALSFSPGDLLMLVAVLVWALYSVLLRRWSAQLQMPPGVLLGVLVLLGVPMILPFYLLELAHAGGFEPSLGNLAAIGYTALFASLISYLCWNHGIKVVGAAKAALSSYLMPVFAALFSYLLLGETLQAFHWFGGALIFSGLALATLPKRTGLDAGDTPQAKRSA